MKIYKSYNVPYIGDYIPAQSRLDDVGIEDYDVEGIANFYCDEISICRKADCKNCILGGQTKKQEKIFMEWHKDRIKANIINH